MNEPWKAMLWQQFGAAIEMLERAMAACPEDLWSDRSRRPEFWNVAYHTLFYLDLYSSGSVAAFTVPPPFNLDEMEADTPYPERVYTKAELQAYLELGRGKCRAAIESLTEESARRRCACEWHDMSEVELVLYNLRHVQHHTGQLYLILRQTTDSTPGWVKRAGWSISHRPSTDLGVSAASLLEEEREQRERELG